MLHPGEVLPWFAGRTAGGTAAQGRCQAVPPPSARRASVENRGGGSGVDAGEHDALADQLDQWAHVPITVSLALWPDRPAIATYDVMGTLSVVRTRISGPRANAATNCSCAARRWPSTTSAPGTRTTWPRPRRHCRVLAERWSWASDSSTPRATLEKLGGQTYRMRGLTDRDVSVAWWDGRTLPLICWEAVVMTSSYPSLTRALAEALVDVLWFIDGCEDEQMNPDDAVKVLEGVAHVVSTLPNDQRQELIELIGEMAAAESDPARREFLDEFPEAFGMIDDAP
ncbi:hypothetical protein [Streptomyces sp. NPDC048106]|uniref:hypothetical protein n=1 Tax=Streptomyces sp. NPDC048106 TaxID=3155750 RepID=UPI0034520F29